MAPQLHEPPTPSPSPPPPPAMTYASNSTLPARVNAATRKQHAELNRLLIQRLPLALPPHADTPLLLSKGLVPFARIFILFEIEWEILLRQFDIKPGSASTHDYQVRKWLATVRPDGLARSHRWKKDLHHLRAVAGPGIYETPDLGDQWVKDMRGLVRRKPHVFIAFAWVFYMAVFSGGRWIRQQLANGGVDFWTQQQSGLQLERDQQSPLLDLPGYSFLSFDGEQDGEDLKALLKTRLMDAESLLTSEEKQDIVNTAQQLFERSILLVHELDRMVWRQKLMSWVPWILIALSFSLVLIYGFGYMSRFRGAALSLPVVV